MSAQDEIGHRYGFLAVERKTAIGRALGALKAELAGKNALSGSGAMIAKELLAGEQIEAGVAELMDATTKARNLGVEESALRAPLSMAVDNLLDDVRRALEEPENDAFGKVYRARAEELKRLGVRARSIIRQYWAGYEGPQPVRQETVGFPVAEESTPETPEQFLQAYDDMTADVVRANYNRVSAAFQHWFAVLRGNPDAAEIVTEFERRLEFDAWWATATPPSGMVGTGVVPWPLDPADLLSARLHLVWWWARDAGEILRFSHSFMYVSSGSLDDMARTVVEQVFVPLSRDLRRQLQRRLLAAGARPSAPASDQVVTIDHNRPEYAEMIAAIEAVEKALR